MKDLFIKLNLQFFADDTPTGDDPQGDTPPATDEPPTLTFEAVQKFLSESEEGQKYIQKIGDKRATEAVKTYETKTLPTKLQEKINELYPAESESDKELRAVRDELETFKRATAQKELLNEALKTAPEYGLPTALVEFFAQGDIETTKSNMEQYKEHFDAAVQAEIAKRLSQAGDTPPPPKGEVAYQQRLEQAREKALRLGTDAARAEYVQIKNEKQ